MNCSRPDLAFALWKLVLFAASPSEKRLMIAKHVFRCIKGTIDTYMAVGGYTINDTLDITAYFDANIDDSHPKFGFTIQFSITTT